MVLGNARYITWQMLTQFKTNLKFLRSCIYTFIYRLNIHAYYDDSFHKRFGVLATRRILALFTMVKTIFSHSSLPTVIEPHLIDISYIRGSSWEANIDTLKYETNI